jgi:TRAP-type C4-dicarboxylate transport system permease small subunit
MEAQMAGSPVLEDGSLLSVIDRRFYQVERVLALASGLAVFILMILAVVSVTGRNAINQPLPGYVDWIEQILPLIGFMGISFAQRDGAHIRMDILVGKLQGRWLWAAEILTLLLVLVLMLLLVWGSFAHFTRAFSFTAPMWSNDSSIDIGLPIWPAKLLVPVAFSVLCIRLCLQLWAYGRALWFGLESPVAVPLVQDAAAQAAEEARTVSGRD